MTRAERNATNATYMHPNKPWMSSKRNPAVGMLWAACGSLLESGSAGRMAFAGSQGAPRGGQGDLLRLGRASDSAPRADGIAAAPDVSDGPQTDSCRAANGRLLHDRGLRS